MKKIIRDVENRKKELKEEIEKQESLKDLCEKTALKKIEIKKRSMVVIQIILFLVLASLIYKYGWNKVEQWTYLAAGILFLSQSIIAWIMYRRSSIGDAFEDKLKEEIKKQYAEKGVVESKYNRLKQELQQVEEEHRKLLM